MSVDWHKKDPGNSKRRLVHWVTVTIKNGPAQDTCKLPTHRAEFQTWRESGAVWLFLSTFLFLRRRVRR
jgi:hypothetical protein